MKSLLTSVCRGEKLVINGLRSMFEVQVNQKVNESDVDAFAGKEGKPTSSKEVWGRRALSTGGDLSRSTTRPADARTGRTLAQENVERQRMG